MMMMMQMIKIAMMRFTMMMRSFKMNLPGTHTLYHDNDEEDAEEELHDDDELLQYDDDDSGLSSRHLKQITQ